MDGIINFIFGQAKEENIQRALFILRVTIGLLTIGHGYPKIIGGLEGWHQLGETFMYPLGIKFLPTMWGFLGAVTEFIGGIMLVLGLGTRIASFALIVMMIIATAWHIQKGDHFNVYSFPLSLVFVFLAFLIIGGDNYSLDFFIAEKR